MGKIKNQMGLTLVELLIVLCILSIVMAITMDIFLFSFKAYKNEDTKWTIQQDARHAIRQITRDVRAASSISSVSGSPILCITQPSNISVKFYIQNSKLYKEISGVKQPLIENAHNVSFTYDNDSNVVEVTLTTKMPNSDIKYSISTKIYSRIMQ